MLEDSRTVRSCDVGFGLTKYITGLEADGRLKFDYFPSVAKVASPNLDIGGGVMHRRDVFVVSVDGGQYQVGKDAGDDHTGSRYLDPSFPESNNHKALMLGSFAYMNVPRIDVLAVGLPVSILNKYKAQQVATWRGQHNVPELYRPSVSRIVAVDHVLVYPQPVGAFFLYANGQENFSEMRDSATLVIDAGHFTLDWLVTRGFRLADERCGSHHGGVAGILQHVAKRIEREIGEQIPNHRGIEEGLRNRSYNVLLHGDLFNFAHLCDDARRMAEDSVNVLASNVGSPADIQRIVLAGGGAYLLEQAVQNKYPRHSIVKLDNPTFGNVAGFQLMATEFDRRLQRRA
jgi:plasmid segregation protein ParM